MILMLPENPSDPNMKKYYHAQDITFGSIRSKYEKILPCPLSFLMTEIRALKVVILPPKLPWAYRVKHFIMKEKLIVKTTYTKTSDVALDIFCYHFFVHWGQVERENSPLSKVGNDRQKLRTREEIIV